MDWFDDLKAARARGWRCPTEEDTDELVAEVDRLRAVEDQLPKYADTGEPIVRGCEVWTSGGPKPVRRVVDSVLNTSVCLDGVGRMSTHQRYCYSTRESAEASGCVVEGG